MDAAAAMLAASALPWEREAPPPEGEGEAAKEPASGSGASSASGSGSERPKRGERLRGTLKKRRVLGKALSFATIQIAAACT